MPEQKPKPEVNKLKLAFEKVAASEHGKIVLKHFMDELGYKNASITIDVSTTEINPMATVYNEARRNFWLYIRKQIPARYLNIIEQETVNAAD